LEEKRRQTWAVGDHESKRIKRPVSQFVFKVQGAEEKAEGRLQKTEDTINGSSDAGKSA
jgi:hypothetical protein